MILRRRYKKKSARIEMVPLIDIVFLLLVFFIYAMLSMAVHRGMKVELPVSSTPEISEDIPLAVSVQYSNGNTSLYLNKERLGLDELEFALRTQVSAMDQEKQILLYADKTVPYQQLYKVLDRISSAGITAISLQAEQKR